MFEARCGAPFRHPERRPSRPESKDPGRSCTQSRFLSESSRRLRITALFAWIALIEGANPAWNDLTEE